MLWEIALIIGAFIAAAIAIADAVLSKIRRRNRCKPMAEYVRPPLPSDKRPIGMLRRYRK